MKVVSSALGSLQRSILTRQRRSLQGRWGTDDDLATFMAAGLSASCPEGAACVMSKENVL